MERALLLVVVVTVTESAPVRPRAASQRRSEAAGQEDPLFVLDLSLVQWSHWARLLG